MSIAVIAFLLLGAVIILPLLLVGYAWFQGYHDYNHGICRDCGGHMEYRTHDSQGTRMYMCPHCYNTVWVFFPVD